MPHPRRATLLLAISALLVACTSTPVITPSPSGSAAASIAPSGTAAAPSATPEPTPAVVYAGSMAALQKSLLAAGYTCSASTEALTCDRHDAAKTAYTVRAAATTPGSVRALEVDLASAAGGSLPSADAGKLIGSVVGVVSPDAAKAMATWLKDHLADANVSAKFGKVSVSLVNNPATKTAGPTLSFNVTFG